MKSDVRKMIRTGKMASVTDYCDLKSSFMVRCFLFVALLCFCSSIVEAQVFRPDPMRIEKALAAEFSYDSFHQQVEHKVMTFKPELVQHPVFEDLLRIAHGKAKKVMIESYFRNELNLAMLQSELNKQVERFVQKLKNKSIADLDEFERKLKRKRVGKLTEHLHEENGQMRIPGAPCDNPDFETCDFSNWTLVTGSVDGSAPFSFTGATTTTSFSTIGSPSSGADQHYITNGGTDTYGFPMVYPGGSCSAAIGDFSGLGYDAAQIRQTFLVSSGDAILTLNYAVALEDGGHAANEQPYFRMRVYDQNGQSITCAAYEAVAGDGQSGWQTSGIWQYKPWSTVFIPLAPYLGQNVTVEFTVGDCSQGGHAGYAYVDASCSAMAMDLSANAVCAGQPLTLNAPAGAASYQWSNGATTQSISTTTPGFYSVIVTPVTGSACSITLDTIVEASPNPVAQFSHNGPQCFGQAVSFTDESTIAANGTISSWLWDFGDGQTSSQQNPSHTFASGGNYNVTLTVSTPAGCSNSTSINVNQPSELLLTPSFTDEVCGQCDGSATVSPNGATAPYSYNWGAAGGNVPTVNGLCSGAYPVTVTDDMGCTANATINVGNGGSLSITSITSTPEACQGDCTGTISITSPGANEFSIDGGITFQTNSNFSNLCAGNYSIVVQNNSGCSASGTTSIVSPNPMVLSSSADTTICIGGTAQVSASVSGGAAPVVLIWDQGLPNGSSHLVNPVINTTYTVFAQDANGCVTPAQQVVVSIHPPLNVIASADVFICPGESATISATASGGNGGPYTYTWTDGNGSNLSGASHSVSPSVTTTYTVTVSDNCGTPVASDQVEVVINPLPQVTFVADQLSGCVPLSVNFTNTTDPNLTAACSWNFGDGSTSSNCVASHVFTQTGCFDISLTVTTPQGCESSLVVPGMICVFPYPVADFVFGPQPANILDPEIQFTNTSSGAIAYEWDFAGLGTSTQTDPVFIFPDEQPGNYEVCLAVENQYSCRDSICKTVVIDDYLTVYVPNVFTPDGDGINDLFFPVIDGMLPGSFQLYIFNRWGEIIFSSEDPAATWNGYHKGNMSKEDVYVWKIILKDNVEKRKRTFVGHVTLLK